MTDATSTTTPSTAGLPALRFRGGGFEIAPRPRAALASMAALLLLWEAASRFGLVSDIFLPSPVQVCAAIYELWADGTLWVHISASLVRILGGWALGTAAGLVIGLAMGIFSIARSAGMPIVSALFPIPKIALLPLLILWFGIGEPSKIATIALGVFFPTVITGFSAVDAVPRNLIRMAQSFDLPWRAIVLKVILPGALPGILAGFRITASIALILVVAAEMIATQYGIGAFLLQAGNLMRVDQLLAGVAMLSLLGLLIGLILSRLERWLLRWR
ncbi:MAG TPA: ABC transporter permease [Alphaproteobacteria bacterium]|nr:ABC transporter permease [Alphaproteobacteria bacterium]